MTKKEALRLLEERYGGYCFGDYVGPLCYRMPCKLKYKWGIYWYKINDKNKRYLPSYFTHIYSITEASILRLLVAHQFIEETYK